MNRRSRGRWKCSGRLFGFRAGLGSRLLLGRTGVVDERAQGFDLALGLQLGLPKLLQLRFELALFLLEFSQLSFQCIPFGLQVFQVQCHAASRLSANGWASGVEDGRAGVKPRGAGLVASAQPLETTRLRPPFLAAYSRRSATTSSAFSDFSSQQASVAHPMLTVMGMGVPSATTGSAATVVRSRSLNRAAPTRFTPRRITANSSPPKRANMSSVRSR